MVRTSWAGQLMSMKLSPRKIPAEAAVVADAVVTVAVVVADAAAVAVVAVVAVAVIKKR